MVVHKKDANCHTWIVLTAATITRWSGVTILRANLRT